MAEQDAFKASAVNASPSHSQSPEVSSKNAGNEVNETVKSLTEKLSAALLNISAKEDLVKQHAKVAEEAVLGKLPLSYSFICCHEYTWKY